MNILHIDEQTGWRGGEQQASYLIRGLAERGHRCFVAGKPGSEYLTRDHGARDLVRIPVPCRGELDLATAYRLSRAVREHNIDILHAHSSHAVIYAVLAKKFAGRGKVVASRRVDFPPNKNAFSRWKYNQPDRIVAISDCIARVLRDFGIPEHKLRTVHSGIDLKRFDVTPLPRSEIGIPEGVPLAGNVAALVGHKDHATLLDAVPAILRDVPEFRLVIAGEGPLRQQIEAQIERLEIGKSVKLLGQRSDVPRLLRALDLFVMSSSEEGLGTSVLDAMACGVPVVATDAGGIPEMVRDGETGFLVPLKNPSALANAVVRAMQNENLRNGLAQNATVLVNEEFTADSMVRENVGVYEELLSIA
ncbi:MAG: glycosyltransferase [Candidatus Hydrogenedentes bacterium]|nr:glycosyltransferase [Candidatus Hydrogenedentota bacterium]